MSDNLPVTLTNLHAQAVGATDRIDTFRAYIALINRGYKGLEKARGRLKTLEKQMASLRDDHTFFKRHRAKLDTLHQVFRNCYANPNKAMRTIDDLVAAYPIEYVMEVCRLGVWRLGKPSGWGFLWMTSGERQAAAWVYETDALPAIAQILPDHRDFLALRRGKIEEQYDDLVKIVATQRQALGAIEAAMPNWTDELKSAAHALKQGEIDRLSQEEREVRRQLLAPPQTEAVG